MCGIAGIARFDRAPIERAMLQRMADALRHRGPDGEGIYMNGRVGFAHRRLAIIDPTGGRQPFVDEASGLALTYNGEVYNYKEIRQDLVDRHRLRTESDTEVVLAAYRERGIDCLSSFRGMFAFALHDRQQNRLFLVRDRVGVKPLYYSVTPERIVFASELNALLQSGCVPTGLEAGAIASYFRYGYVPTPRSIYADVKKLLPAHYLLVDLNSGQTRLQRYWTLSPDISCVGEAEALDRLNAILADAVRLSLRSDVPFGSFLSGGVDSSIVSALMASELTEPVHTFTIGFREEQNSELPYARLAAERLQSDHSETIVSSGMLQSLLPSLARQFGEPFGDSSAIPTYYVSQAAASKVRMVLSGDGGDELFAGYDSYPMTYLRMIGRTQESSGRLRRMMRDSLSWLAPMRWGRAANSLQNLHDSQREIFRGESLSALLMGEVYLQNSSQDSGYDGRDSITDFQYQDLCTYLPDDVLTKVDRMSMANSLEVRVPLLDHKVVEFAFSLPLSMKISDHAGMVRTKHLLKRSAERFFSPTFLNRRKMGFGIPVVQWLTHDLEAFVRDNFAGRNQPIFDHLHWEVVEQLVLEFYSGHQGHAAKIWLLLMFKLWADGALHTSAMEVSS